MTTITYPFLKKAGKIINSDQSRSLLLTGNIQDLFGLSRNGETDYVPLTDFLCENWKVPDRILMVYELNGPIRFMRSEDRDFMKDAWLRWRTGFDSDSLAVKKILTAGAERTRIDDIQRSFDDHLLTAVGNPTVALELLRQMCLCSRTALNPPKGPSKSLIILIEAADLVIPEGEISRLSDTDRRRVSICQDWFSDPGFMNGDDAVILLAESRSLINQRVARLPQVIDVTIDAPDAAQRLAVITWFGSRLTNEKTLKTWGTVDDLAGLTAGLSLHALIQLLKSAVYDDRPIEPPDVIAKVEEYIQSQLGEDIVEFKKPSHTLDDLVGFSGLKDFLRTELIPRFKAGAAEALPGAAVCGPVGGGKTFIFEAVASELDMIVLVLKNLRSQWFGQTDVILERLRRVLDALSRVLIFVDEADTQFGGLGVESHSTERRLTGKIQAMMSDTQLRGRVFWLLMTARIHMLSPDIRRPGRVGDLIIPVLDPEDDDRDAFVRWCVEPVFNGTLDSAVLSTFSESLKTYSAAAFASLRSELKAVSSMKRRKLTPEDIAIVIQEILPPDIDESRNYQTLQALVNCTRRSLLPKAVRDTGDRSGWVSEIRELEAKGIR